MIHGWSLKQTAGAGVAVSPSVKWNLRSPFPLIAHSAVHGYRPNRSGQATIVGFVRLWNLVSWPPTTVHPASHCFPLPPPLSPVLAVSLLPPFSLSIASALPLNCLPCLPAASPLHPLFPHCLPLSFCRFPTVSSLPPLSPLYHTTTSLSSTVSSSSLPPPSTVPLLFPPPRFHSSTVQPRPSRRDRSPARYPGSSISSAAADCFIDGRPGPVAAAGPVSVSVGQDLMRDGNGGGCGVCCLTVLV